jgi:hypothetical protein
LVIASISAWFSWGVSSIQEWSIEVSPSPNGRSSVWLWPAEKPSAEMEMSQSCSMSIPSLIAGPPVRRRVGSPGH